MFIASKTALNCCKHSYLLTSRRTAATLAKEEGDISSVFLSLSGRKADPLPPRFAELKHHLIRGNEAKVQASWERLISSIDRDVREIASLGPKVIPEIEFGQIGNASDEFKNEFRRRGVGVIKGVIPEEDALQLKADLRHYISQNPQTKSFPPEAPSVYELYFSPSQVRARAHQNLLAAQLFLMSFWHSKDPDALISVNSPAAYADRLRIRFPGDARFALGPHVDSGSVERWEENGYGLGGIYDKIWQGSWEQYDPWEASRRLPVVSDLYNGAGACSMFRMFQGWLSMSTTGPNEGTLLVNPLFKKATAYFLLRPFFAPSGSETSLAKWQLEPQQNTTLQGAAPGQCQEFNDELHPHLRLEQSMIHIPTVKPGIHAVDKVHQGNSDSSVLYIPVCPLTLKNAEYLATQRDEFRAGFPGPDFPGGVGESNHVGRLMESDLESFAALEGLQAMGLRGWDTQSSGLARGEVEMRKIANRILGHAT